MRGHAPAHEREREQERGRQEPPRQASPPEPRLQQTAGNQAVGRLLGASRITLAREIVIGKERITPYSRGLAGLYQTAVLPWLEQRSLKARGVKTRLMQFVKNGQGAKYKDPEDFLGKFMPWLEGQKRKVRGGGEVGVLQEFTTMGMSRPAFPEDLKLSKRVQQGDNLRHVVRNATLKRALDIELRRVDKADAKKHFSAIATKLGIDLETSEPLEQIVKAIYKKVYLNPDNLFAGDGTTNQVIGLAADDVRKAGEEMLSSEEELVRAHDVIAIVREKVDTATNKVQGGSETHKGDIVAGLMETVRQAIESLADGGYVLVEDAANMVVDIGLGFGFDLIDGRVPEDRHDLAERQGALLEVEMALDAFITSGGQKGKLDEILKKFLTLGC